MQDVSDDGRNNSAVVPTSAPPPPPPAIRTAKIKLGDGGVQGQERAAVNGYGSKSKIYK